MLKEELSIVRVLRRVFRGSLDGTLCRTILDLAIYEKQIPGGILEFLSCSVSRF